MNEEQEYLWKRRYELKVRALMNRMYCQERQRIFEWREGFIKAASILAGSVAFAKVSSPELVQWRAAFIATASTASPVFGYGAKARDSVKRSTEWARLERDIELVGERGFTEEQLNQWTARADEIEAGEPAAHRILLERCYERAVETLGGKAEIKPGIFGRHFPPIMIP